MVTTFLLSEEQIQVLEESLAQGKNGEVTPHQQVMEEVNQLLNDYRHHLEVSKINARDKQKANQ